jgi:hypothetical protein
MLNRLQALFVRTTPSIDTAPAPGEKENPTAAKLKSHAQALPLKRRDARGALEFNAGLPARTWQDGVKPIKQRSIAMPMTARAPVAKAPTNTASTASTVNSTGNQAEQVAARQPLRGQRMFGFGTGGVAQPSAKPLLTAVQELCKLAADGTNVDDPSDVESLLQQLEQPNVTAVKGSPTAEVRLGAAELGSTRMKIQRTGPDDTAT